MPSYSKDKLNYGCLGFRPRLFQSMNTIKWYVTWQCVVGFFEGFVVNGIINIIIVSLEKRYQLSSKKSGLIASANDFGALSIYILVGFLGTHANKPRIIGAGIMMMALGCFIFTLPHFIGGPYEYTLSGSISNTTDNLCSVSNSSTKFCSARQQDTEMNTELYYALLLTGNALIGIGAVPNFVLGLTYIEENSRTKDSSFFFGCNFAAASVGVSIGFATGAKFLSIFVDIDKVDVNSLSIEPLDAQWVGAWWIGVLIASSAFLLILIPICGYPKHLPGYKEIQKLKVSEVQQNTGDIYKTQINFGKSIKHLPLSIWLLLRNPVFLFIVLGGTVEVLILGGFATFGAKIIAEIFNTDISEAGYLMGLIMVFGSGGGMLFGGYVVKRFDLKLRSILRFCCACQVICICLGPVLLASCPSQQVIGVSAPYPGKRESTLISTCNAECGCSNAGFEPVCYGNEVVFFSPCHAGCSIITKENGTTMYEQCSCINNTLPSVTLKNGRCLDKCVWYYISMGILFLLTFLTFSTMSPLLTALYRCIPYQQRALGTGIQFTMGKLFGTTPAPVLLGWILDSTCLVWQDNCGEKGNCWIYGKLPLGIRITLWWIITKLFGVASLLIAQKVYKAEKTSQKMEEELEETHGISLKDHCDISNEN